MYTWSCRTRSGRNKLDKVSNATCEGNVPARKLVNSVFEVADRRWRGVGWISKSGYKLRWEYREHDAEKIFEVKDVDRKQLLLTTVTQGL